MASIKSPRLIVFNHLAKTGGSTFASILRKGFQARYVHTWDLHGLDPADDEPVFCIIEDYLDWVRLKGATTQIGGRTMILEGHVWGVEKLFDNSCQLTRATMIRDPFRTFLSHYSFTVKENVSVPIPVETFYAEKFPRNNFVNFFGEGDLARAKETLEGQYNLIGLCEKYKQTAALTACFFDFPMEAYRVENKSDSEKIELPEGLKDRFMDENRQDMLFYEFAVTLFDSRYASISGDRRVEPKRVKEISSDKSYRYKTARNRLDIVALLAEGRVEKAVQFLEQTKKATAKRGEGIHLGEILALGRCHAQLENFAKATENFLFAMKCRPSHALYEAVSYLKEHEPEATLSLLQKALSEIETIVCDSPANAYSVDQFVLFTSFLSSVLNGMQRHAASALRCEKSLQFLNRRLGVAEEDELRTPSYTSLRTQTGQRYGNLRFGAERGTLFERYGKDRVIGRLEIEAALEVVIRRENPGENSEVISLLDEDVRHGDPVSGWYVALLIELLRSLMEAPSPDVALAERVLERLMALLKVPEKERRIADMLLRKGQMGLIPGLLASYHYAPTIAPAPIH